MRTPEAEIHGKKTSMGTTCNCSHTRFEVLKIVFTITTYQTVEFSLCSFILRTL